MSIPMANCYKLGLLNAIVNTNLNDELN